MVKSISLDGHVIYITPERRKEFHELWVEEVRKEIDKEIIEEMVKGDLK